MRPPEFWNHKRGRDAAPLVRMLLAPAASLYTWAGARRLRRETPVAVARPVICVGNLTLGGTGKTPIARALRAMLAETGLVAHVVSRGHGGRLRGPVRVDPVRHSAADVGDEPLLHALDGPAWIARDRAAGANAAIAARAEAIILDDGFQNPGLKKDLSILVFDAEAGIGNERVFPAGPLREPLAGGLARAQMVVLLEKDADRVSRPDWLAGFAGPVLHAFLAPDAPPPAGALIGFCGIGRPARFFDSVRKAGGDLIDGVPFPDHHVFSADELKNLRQLAAAHRARLITTEKDLVRLPPVARADIAAFPVTARFADSVPMRQALAALFARDGKAG